MGSIGIAKPDTTHDLTSNRGSDTWPTAPIGELFEIGAGKSVTPAARSGERKHPFLRTSNIYWGRVDLTEVSTMHFTDEEIETKSLHKGDLLVCEGGDIGRSAIWNGELEQCGFQNHLHRLRLKDNDIVPRFIMYYLQVGFTQLGIYEGAGNKTTIPNLSRSRLAALEVPKPPKPEQEKIAAVLWKVQKAVEVQDKLVRTTRELKAATLRRLFTRGLRNEPLKETEIGPVPESWEVVPIGKLFEIVQGLSLKGNLSHDGTGYPFLRTSNVYWGRIELESVSRMHIDPTQLMGKDLQVGDLLVCEGGEIGRAAVWQDELPHCTFQNHLHRLRAKDPDQINSRFVMAWLDEGFRHRRLYEGAGNKTTIPNLSRARLAELFIPVPTITEQNGIAHTFQTLDRKIALHEKKRTALQDLFKTLLHHLMTARIRVHKLDIDTGEVVL
jgi:type I restriction enzyme S subunit